MDEAFKAAAKVALLAAKEITSATGADHVTREINAALALLGVEQSQTEPDYHERHQVLEMAEQPRAEVRHDGYDWLGPHEDFRPAPASRAVPDREELIHMETTAEERADWLSHAERHPHKQSFTDYAVARLIRDLNRTVAALRAVPDRGDRWSIAELQTEIGRLQSILHHRVLGDPRIGVSSAPSTKEPTP